MLAKLGYSHIVNTASIRFAEEETPHPKTGQARCKVTFLDGKTLLVDGSLDLIERLASQIVPAPPGYSVIEADSPETFAGDPTFTIFPVVAFRAMADACLLPLLPTGEPISPWGWALIYPDGRCDALWDRLYSSVDEFKADLIERRAKQREQTQ